jgi:hypothetical protein
VPRIAVVTATLVAAAACADAIVTAPAARTNPFANVAVGPIFVTVDVPGSAQTRVLDLNEPGDLVGFYRMAGVTHGFFRGRDERFVTIDAPNATATFPHGINDRGDITGRFIEAGSNHTRGFLLIGGTYSVFDFPGMIHTEPEFINERGDIAGKYRDATGFQHGFVLKDDVFHTIDVPGAASTYVQVYTVDGLAVGDIRDGVTPTIVHSFTLEDGVFTIFDVPGATLTLARAVGKYGNIVGIYVDPSGRHGFLRDRDGNFERIDYPGASSTEIYGANRRGTLSGSYVAASVEHGFLRVER